jgi:mono/diheme cytochrome c family protein
MRRLLLRVTLAGAIAALVLSLAAAQPRHGAHGDPPGWSFKLPPGGDPARGRVTFAKYECYACHEIRGEAFPAASQRDSLGPDLVSMATHHTPAFLAESIMNPNAFVDTGKGYAGHDGVSKMPSFSDSMTLQELVDVVAFLKSLGSPGGQRHHH